jgi:hypothetical protein
MKLDNEDKMLIGAGVIALGTLGFFWWKNKKKNEANTIDIPSEVIEPAQIPATATPPFSSNLGTNKIDTTKVLRKGSKGLEVKELQKILGIKQDGDFGKITLNALLSVKGVSQISLDAFRGKISKPSSPKTATVMADVPLKKGQKIMVNTRSGFTAQDVQVKADGSYFTNGSNKVTGLDFGDEIGVIKSVLIRTDGLVRYVVENTFLGVSRLLWVSHKNVALIK